MRFLVDECTGPAVADGVVLLHLGKERAGVSDVVSILDFLDKMAIMAITLPEKEE